MTAREKNKQFRQQLRERQSGIARFKAAAAVSTHVADDGHTETDYADSAGLVLSEHYGQAPAWRVQCGGPRPLFIGDTHHHGVEQARDLVSRLREGDESLIMKAYFLNRGPDHISSGFHTSNFSYFESRAALQRSITVEKHIKQGVPTSWAEEDRLRDIQRMQFTLKDIQAFAKRERLPLSPLPKPGRWAGLEDAAEEFAPRYRQGCRKAA
jgi:hypothetical protein